MVKDGHEHKPDVPRRIYQANSRSSAANQIRRSRSHSQDKRDEQVGVLPLGERERAISRHPTSNPIGLRSKSVDGDDSRSTSRDWAASFALFFIYFCSAVISLTIIIGVLGWMI